MLSILDYPNAKPLTFEKVMSKEMVMKQKTVTRRPIKPQPLLEQNGSPGLPSGWHWQGKGFSMKRWPNKEAFISELLKHSPVKAGDIFYVQEPWAMDNLNLPDGKTKAQYYYKADFNDNQLALRTWLDNKSMPPEAARTFGKITRVSIQRLNDMSLEDYQAEGIHAVNKGVIQRYPSLAETVQKIAFSVMWDSFTKTRSIILTQILGLGIFFQDPDESKPAEV